MDSNVLMNDQKQMETMKAELTYSERQQTGWETAESFHKTAKIDDGQGAKYARFDSMDIYDLCAELLADEDRKSYTFTAMQRAIEDLTKLASSKGKIQDGDKKGTTADFFETLFAAKQSVNEYLFQHAGYRWTGKGERRIQISLRLRNILNSLDKEIEKKTADLSGEAGRKMEYDKEQLSDEEREEREKKYRAEKAAADALLIAKTGLYGPDVNADPKLKQKITEKWVVGGYTDKLKDLINGVDMSDTEKLDEFLAFLEDRNNRMLANRLTLSMMTDNADKVTLGMPGLKEELKEYLTKKLTDEDMELKPDELSVKIGTLIGTFETENTERLTKLTARRDELLKKLNLLPGDTSLYNYPYIEEILKYDTEEEFREQLEILKDRTDRTNRMISDILKAGYSVATRAAICRKLFKNLGTLRIFGTEDQIRDQTYVFLDMLKYTAPREYLVERVLDNVLKDHKIDKLHRDSFVIAITENHPEVIGDYSSDFWKIRGEEFAKRYHANSKTFAKIVDKEGVHLTREQWDELEKVALESGQKKESEFKGAMAAILARNATDKRLSRREYLEKRKFDDAQKEPGRIRRAAEERRLIEGYGNFFDDRFLLNLENGETDLYAPYRKLDAAYRGAKDQLKAREETEKRLHGERVGHVNRILRDNGFTTEDRKAFTAKCKWMISGILEITEDMTDDERLKCERINIERFGVRTWEEALGRFDEVAKKYNTAEGRQEAEDAKVRFENGRRILEEYDNGKYRNFTDFLVNIPDVYRAMMSMTPDEFAWFASSSIDQKLGAFLKGIDEAKAVPTAVSRQFAFSYLRRIYEGGLDESGESFATQLNDYYRKVLTVAPEGGSSISGNLKAVEKYLKKDYKKRKIKDNDAQAYLVGVLSYFQDMMNDTARFELLFDKNKVMELAKERSKEVEQGIGRDLNVATVRIDKAFTDELPPVDTELETAVENIRLEKKAGVKNRQTYLGVDAAALEKVRLGKSLVRVGQKGGNLVNLNTGKADSMRVRIQKLCSNLELPQVLVDALVEEGASDSVSDRITGIMWSDTELLKHATSMHKMYQLLRKDGADDKAMTDEEAVMYIVKCYGDKQGRRHFTGDNGPDVASLRKQDSYKEFRADYAKLKKFEAIESDDPSLERERIDMARNLRTMLLTGIGYPKGSSASLSDIIDRNTRYLEDSIKVLQLIRDKVDEDIRERDLRTSEIARDRRVFAFRQYFLNRLISDCENKSEIDLKEWEDRINEVKNKKNLWENMEFRRDSISSEDYKKAESARIESAAGEADLANAIRNNVYLFKGRVNKYEKLDEDQKKFFAIALMLMDKGAIGMDTAGTSALLTPKEAKTKETAVIERELSKYVAGQPYHIEIDYKEAYNKLVNYGETKFFYMEGYALSRSAYDKALQFAQAITAKKQAFGEKDTVRMNDGISSMNAAYTKYGKTQLNELEKFRDDQLAAEDVKKIFLSYAAADTTSYKEIAKKTARATITHNRRSLSELDETVRMKLRMERISKRFEKMNETDLKIFLRIMQDRSVLDKTTITKTPNGPEYADQEKRNALLEALCADPVTRSEVMFGFDDNESCHKALISALSFQLRDDLNFKGKELTKSHFEKSSFNRKTMIDWDLVERAFAFIDEVKERRASVHALAHAADYIEQSGNKKAIEENRKLENQFKEKESFSQENFEDYIKKQADKDASDESDLDRVIAGYHALTDREKSLFFRVLSRRDLLDISRKDYKKSFFGIKDRNYVNQAERDKLIDQYINSSLEGNLGIITRPGDHYDALKTLFSTQLSDREKFDSKKDIKKMTANERRLFLGRTTAIDWKLFKRALNFVNRATEELEYQEGNAQLYKGAGLLSENGKISMNYAFLRKNFHQTGNQWGRYLGRLAVRTIREETGADGILDTIVSVVGDGTKYGSMILGLSSQGVSGQGFDWLKRQVKDLRDNVKAVGKISSEFNVKGPEVGKKKKTEEQKKKEEEDEKKRRENLLYYEQLKEGIDNVIAQSTSVKNAATDVAKFLRDNYATRFEAGKNAPKYESKPKADESNLVVKITKGAPVDRSKGDIRDTANKVYSTEQKLVKTVKDVSKIVGYVPGLDKVQDLAIYATEKATLKFLNEKILGKTTDLSKVDRSLSTPDQMKKETELLTRTTEEYADNVFKSIVTDVLGEETASSLLNLEQGYYNIKKVIGDQIKAAVDGINYAKKCVAHVKNITKAARNLAELSNVKKNAADMRSEDEETLQKASEKRLSPEQAAKVDAIVKKHRGMSGLSGDITKAVLSFGIAEETINLAFETAGIAGGKLNAGSEMISKAVKAGIEFAMFAMRIATDRAALNSYFTDTDAGKAVVDKIRSGFVKTGNSDMVARIDGKLAPRGAVKNAVDTSLVDIISDARGYEHTSELVENTGMSMAQSLVFSASRFNPMVETRLIAVTVMSIMGLADKIGDTSAETVEKLFNAFRMKR